MMIAKIPFHLGSAEKTVRVGERAHAKETSITATIFTIQLEGCPDLYAKELLIKV